MSLLPNMNLIADSLGWAVLHSLWQGVVAAGIVLVVRNITRERASEARYFTGIVTLCALLCAFIGTFFYYYNAGAVSGAATNADIMQTITIGFSETASTGNPLMRLGDFTGQIGVFWTVCFAVLGMRYLSAFRLTHKLRKHGLSDLPADWQARFRALVNTSGVSPKVRAYFSEYVSSPITFGFLKPIVLLPTWFFTGMTPEQCEAVLLHELAHIRRHDYLTNILQIAIKTVFFYHPAVQFICKGLDTDREHACDDFAVMLTKNPEGLATALGTIRLKAARDGGVFALSASGKDAPLMHRLKRLMGTNVSKTGAQSLQKGTSRGLAATAMIGTALALVMTLGATVSQAHPHKEAQKENKIEIPDWDKLAGAATPTAKNWDRFEGDQITVNGNTYKSTAFSVTNKGGEYYAINGKKYPSKYRYSVYSKGGQDYVVKQKNGKRYMEIGDNWFRVDGSAPTPPTPTTAPYIAYTYGYVTKDGETFKVKTKHKTGKSYIKVNNNWDPITIFTTNKDHGHDHIKINGKTYNLNTLPTPQTPPTPSSTNYWVSDQVLAATEARAEAASDRREAALERAEELRIHNYERQIAKMERKIAHKELDLARDEAGRARDIGHIERDIAKKQAEFERKVHNNPNMSQGELGRMQGEIGRMQGEIGQLQGANGRGQGDLGRLQGELGRMQGEIGRIQGEWGQREAAIEQKKYYKMRDQLIPLLKADGFMKNDRSKVTIKMTPTDIFINGRQLANAQESKYCDIVSKYINRKGDVKKIVIKPGYLHVSQKKDGHTSSFTHNEN